MGGPLRVRMTDAQVSALECRDPDGLGPVTLAAWQGRFIHLIFDRADADALWAELNDASNAEDGQAVVEGCFRARRAAASLSALASKVSKAARAKEVAP